MKRTVIGPWKRDQPSVICLTGLLLLLASVAPGAEAQDGAFPAPRLVTAETRGHPQALAELQKPVKIFFEDDFKANDVGQSKGELAAWIDGKRYIHCQGIRWRSSPDVRLKRFDLGVYVHAAAKDNPVWYDDVALSTGYIGPKGNASQGSGATGNRAESNK